MKPTDKPKAEGDSNHAPIKGMLPKDDLPKPPKIDAIQVGNPPQKPEPITADVEWMRWLAACRESFASLKAARNALAYSENIKAAAILAESVKLGWETMNESRP